jgi:hypothetical protein
MQLFFNAAILPQINPSRHLRHVLHSFLEYYNSDRTHLALSKDAPIARAVTSVGAISSRPILGGCIGNMFGSDFR